MNRIMCIYKIYCLSNYKIYIGSSMNVSKRWQYHIQDLKKGSHRNNYLQHAWNKYGEENFVFSIIETIEDKNELVNREQYWMDYYQSHNLDIGFNLCPTAESQLGHKWTNEQKKKQSERMKGKMSSEEARKLKSYQGDNPAAKLSKDDVINVVKKYNNGETPKDIANSLGLTSCTTVRNIIHRKTWTDITDQMEILYRKRTPCKHLSINVEIILKIREKYKNGYTPLQISKELNLKSYIVKRICKNETWSDCFV